MNIRLKKFFVRLLCCIIPVATWRRTVRTTLMMPRGTKYMNEAEFAEYIKGKTVAVVGNGPQQIGKKTGAEIDSADIIVRFNTFDLTNHSDDYGTRTDVWVNGCAGDYDDDKYLDIAKKCEYVIWRGSPVGKKKEIALLKFFKKCSKSGITINFLPHARLEQCKSQQVFANKWFPTLGFVVLWYLKTFTNPKTLKIYGFSFLDETLTKNDLKKIPHFYHTNENNGETHNMNIEVELLKQLFTNTDKRIK